MHPMSTSSAKVELREGKYLFKILTTEDEIQEAYRLRYDVFQKELGWIEENSTMLDIDAFDNGNTILMGVFDIENFSLLAQLRVSLPETPFMMEQVFDFLIPDYKIPKTREVIEISRACTDPASRSKKIITKYGAYTLSMLLYKGLFQWSLQTEAFLLYMVMDQKLYRLLRFSGFPIHPLHSPHAMPDGVYALTGTLDWREFIERNLKERRPLLNWFTLGIDQQEMYIPPSPQTLALLDR